MKYKQKESGQSFVILAGTMFVLLGFAGLVADFGALYAKRRETQNIVDNASLAGGYAICKGNNVGNAVTNVVTENNFSTIDPNDTLTINFPPTSGVGAGNTSYVEVIITADVKSIFLQFITGEDLISTVRSVAHCESVSGDGYPPVFALADSCTNTVDISGSELTMEGGLHTNHNLTISGSDVTFNGNVTYGGSLNVSGSNINYNPGLPDSPLNISVQTNPLMVNIDDYAPGGLRAIAAAADGNKYYSTTSKMDMGWLKDNGLYNDSTGILDDGLYYTTDDIDLGDSDIQGNNVTFVTNNGLITFGGSNMDVSPYVDGLLAFTTRKESGSSQCDSPVIKLSGSGNDWSGVIYAPLGQIENGGSDNSTVDGSLIGYTIKLNGSGSTIQYNASFLPPEPDVLEISE